MTEIKAAWMEGYEAGYAAAQEELDKLTAERDAAVADIEHFCKYCKKGVECDDADCIADREDHWQWRGLSLVEKTSDKEVE